MLIIIYSDAVYPKNKTTRFRILLLCFLIVLFIEDEGCFDADVIDDAASRVCDFDFAQLMLCGKRFHQLVQPGGVGAFDIDFGVVFAVSARAFKGGEKGKGEHRDHRADDRTGVKADAAGNADGVYDADFKDVDENK